MNRPAGRRTLGTVFAAAVLAAADAQVLYDPGLGTLPTAQGWTYLSLPGGATMTFGDDATRLDTMALSQILAGFSRVAPVSLNRAQGFTLRFNLQVVAEDHGVRVDRAGVSVTVLADDKRGIELGFWPGRVWAQADQPMFTHAEEASWDSEQGFAEYALSVAGDTYSLTVNGAALLSGPVRDYTPFAGVIDPYETPNFLFFGDNTTSAKAVLALRRIELVPAAPPALGIERTGAGSVVARWTGPADAWQLQQADDLFPAPINWQPVSEPVDSSGGTNQVILPVGPRSRWFRLAPPPTNPV